MKKIKNFAHWRAEQIAKVALLNSGFNAVYESHESASDLVAISGATSNQQYLVEVKASKSPRRRLAALARDRAGRPGSQPPLIVVVVDETGANGVFNVISSGKASEIHSLNRSELEKVSGSAV